MKTDESRLQFTRGRLAGLLRLWARRMGIHGRQVITRNYYFEVFAIWDRQDLFCGERVFQNERRFSVIGREDPDGEVYAWQDWPVPERPPRQFSIQPQRRAKPPIHKFTGTPRG